MSVDKEKMLELFEGFKDTLVKLMDERDEFKDKAEELRTTKDNAESKLRTLEEESEKLRTAAAEAESAKSEAVETLQKERDDLKAEMDQITSQLSRVSELYREASAEKEKLQEKVDVSDLLAIYITLIETVFGGKPHARVLYTLHDVGAAITRKNIEASTGIMATAVMKAIHDLRNADLVSYDDNSQEVTLIKDILART